jgi:hypothetical protein
VYGKTVLAKTWAVQVMAESPVIWLPATRLAPVEMQKWLSSLGITQDLATLLTNVAPTAAYLIIDGLDRVGSDAFDNLRGLLNIINRQEDSTAWRLLIPCQPETYETNKKQLVDIVKLSRIDVFALEQVSLEGSVARIEVAEV